MNRPTQPVPETDVNLGPELSDAELDAWIARNRDPLKASLDVARAELAQGRSDKRTVGEIIAEGTRQHLAKR